jgi:hypothetical protein
MTNQDISAGKRLQQKIADRLAVASSHLKAQESAQAESVVAVVKRPELPFLYQG